MNTDFKWAQDIEGPRNTCRECDGYGRISDGNPVPCRETDYECRVCAGTGNRHYKNAPAYYEALGHLMPIEHIVFMGYKAKIFRGRIHSGKNRFSTHVAAESAIRRAA
ncbi:hypothetical protein V3390_09350 [Luteimonas sp. FXH3W]|uniref:Uncharacterized protein n=1 Tax=Aquilutibacter rugosus TaxID=3115820 RepID=A0ABU7V256_9GAMM